MYVRNEQFLYRHGEYFCRNEIWRDVADRLSGNTLCAELMKTNCALVKNMPQGIEVIEVDSEGRSI